MGDWRRIGLEISGQDLLAAGIEPGPPVGAGLQGALDLKLNGELERGPGAGARGRARDRPPAAI